MINKYSCYLMKNRKTNMAADVVETFIIVQFRGTSE